MRKIVFMSLITGTLFATNHALSQTPTLVMPSNPDIYWYTANPSSGINAFIAGINTAMIDFNTTQSCGRNYGTLIVSDYYGNNTGGGVVFTDACSGNTIKVNYPLTLGGTTLSGRPDIIVGNNSTNPSTDYIVAVAFNKQIDYFKVSYTGTYTFTVTYLSSTIITTAVGLTIHLDVIAEAGNTSATGLPWCDKFVVKWDDGSGGIYAYQASLNSPPATISSGTLINSGTGTFDFEPDVAAIQRTVSSVDDIALITWTDGTSIYYCEWDISASSLSPIATFTSASGTSMPRIDAPDDYTINAPGSSSVYKIVAEVNNKVYAYDSYFGSSFVNVSGIWSPFAIHYAPSVAFGPNSNTEYAVVHNTSGTPSSVYMEPIDWLTPGSLALDPSSTPDYFLVNSSGVKGGLSNFKNAVSTPCNYPADRTLVTWITYNGSTTNDDVYYKLTDYNPGPGTGYAFRHAAEPDKPEENKVYPNPADDFLTISCIGTNCSYRITDISGRTLLNGYLNNNKQDIDVANLTPGSYIVQIYEDAQQRYTSVFIKQ
jgi:hypothetical protein